jgi:hypothetical protein
MSSTFWLSISISRTRCRALPCRCRALESACGVARRCSPCRVATLAAGTGTGGDREMVRAMCHACWSPSRGQRPIRPISARGVEHANREGESQHQPPCWFGRGAPPAAAVAGSQSGASAPFPASAAVWATWQPSRSPPAADRTVRLGTVHLRRQEPEDEHFKGDQMDAPSTSLPA